MTTVIVIGMLVLLFFFMFRSNKKQERETAEMRNNLEVGDEITTIGGIIGEIVKIKEETVTIETGKDRTKIRILRSAVRVVDVHAYEKRGDGKKPEAQTENNSQIKKIKAKELTAEPAISTNVDTSAEEANNGENAAKRKRGKKKNTSAPKQAESVVEETTEAVADAVTEEATNYVESKEDVITAPTEETVE